VPRKEVCAGLRGAPVEIERRLDGTHWLRFRGRYLPLMPCPNALRSASPSGLRPPGLADQRTKPLARIKTKYSPPPGHPWRRTFLLCVDTGAHPRSDGCGRVNRPAEPSNALLRGRAIPRRGKTHKQKFMPHSRKREIPTLGKTFSAAC
jgi:hypothetical protein